MAGRPSISGPGLAKMRESILAGGPLPLGPSGGTPLVAGQNPLANKKVQIGPKFDAKAALRALRRV